MAPAPLDSRSPSRLETDPSRTAGRNVPASECPVAIVGMGCMFPRAGSLTEYWRVIVRGEDGITEVPPTHWASADYYDPDPRRPDHTYCTRGGFLSAVPFDPTEFGIPPTILEATDTTQLLSLVAAKAALEDAGYGDDREFNRDRVSVILGITGTQELVIPLGARLGHPLWRKALAEAGVSPEVAERVVRRIADGYVSWQENSFPGLLGNVVAGRIANRLNLRGTNCVIDAACASSLGAIHLAMLELATGRCDMALSGGADALNDIFMHMCFSKTPALSPTGDARPFDAEADGTVLGEGIGIVALKRLEDARRDGDRIYAVIRSIGTSSDGRSQSIYAPHAAGQARCLRNAYELAGIAPRTVTLIEAHGTGTKVGDAVEMEALRTVFRVEDPPWREARGDGRWCAVGSVKSQIGHAKAAAGAAGLIKAALALRHRCLPPTLKVRAPNPKLNLADGPFYINTEPRPWLTPDGAPRRAGISAFGFGGSNFHAVLEEHPSAVSEPAWDGSVRILAFSAENPGALRDQIDALRSELDRGSSAARLAWLAAETRRRFRSDHSHRLCIVARREDSWATLLDDAARAIAAGQGTPVSSRQKSTAASSSGVYYGSASADGRLAFVFPGQGSQYVGMARRTACLFPEMIETLAAADAAIRTACPPWRGAELVSDCIFPIPAFDEAESGIRRGGREAQALRLTRTEIAQPALGAIETGLSRVLNRFAVRPDAVCGHSFGELVALHVAGVFDESTLHALARLRGRLMAGDGDRGVMLAVKAPLAELDQLVSSSRLDVVLANRNAPNQGVLSGSREAVAEAAALCRTRGFVSKPLAVSGAFHSRLMEGAVGPLRNAIDAAAMSAPAVEVYANATARPYPAQPAELKALLGRQIVSPVDFVGQIEAMHGAGVRTFVEVGPKSVLSGLIGAILGDRPHRVIPMDASQGRGCGVEDLAHVLCALAAEGRGVDLTAWERPAREPRSPRMVVPLCGANYRASQRLEVASQRSQPSAQESTGQGSAAQLRAPVPAPAGEPEEAASLESSARGDTHAVKNVVGPVSMESVVMNQQELSRSPDPGNVASSSSPELTAALELMREGIRSMQALQEQTAAAHAQFLRTQEAAHRAVQQVLEGQHRLVAGSLGLESPTTAAPVPSTMSAAASVAPTTELYAPADTTDRCDTASRAAARPAPPSDDDSLAPVSSSSPTADRDDGCGRDEIESLVLGVVCEKTGYPREMVSLEMDVEADLGIDSIKRVEIIAAIEEKDARLTSIKPEHMGALRTLAQIVDYMAQGLATASSHRDKASSGAAVPYTEEPPSPAASLDGNAFSSKLLAVVAELTGYPLDMLNVDMDMEADLGIDSIKRVEILAAVESKTPNLPPVKPEFMGAMRTLRQVVEYYVSHAPSGERRETAPASRETCARRAACRTSAQSLDRSVLELVDLPSRDAAFLKLAGEVWIAGAQDALSDALCAEFGRRGHAARRVSLDEIPRRTREGAVGGLIVLAPECSEAVSIEGVHDFLRGALLAARSLADDLGASAARGGALFATVTRLDGAFGLRSPVVGNPTGHVLGGLAGLAKTAAVEWADVSCRAVDVDPAWEDVQAVAARLVDEFFIEGPVEVGLGASRRSGLSLRKEPIARGEMAVAAGDVVVISGGARGVAVEAAEALARRCTPTIVLLGRTPMPAQEPAYLSICTSETEIKQALLKQEFADAKPTPVELQRAFERVRAARQVREGLERIRAAGATVVYESVDVRDAGAVRSALEAVRRRYGPVRAMIHAAGVLEDRLIRDKSAEQFDRVFGTKVGGLFNLFAAVDAAELRHVVLFSSAGARFGNAGQSDYAMANEALNKWAQATAGAHPSCRVVSINWGPWDGGMVTESLKRAFARRGVDLIPLDAGAEAMVDEMLAADARVEVVLGSWSAAPAPRAADVAAPAAPAADGAADSEHVSSLPPMSVVFERVLDGASHPFLRSHVLGGRPVLPAAMMLEWMAQAALHAHPGLVLQGAERFRILRPAAISEAALPIRLAVARPRRDNGAIAVDVELQSAGAAPRAVVHAFGTILLGQVPAPAPAAPETDDVLERAYPRGIDEAYDEILFHGPLLRGIREVRGMGDRGIVARLDAAGPPRSWMTDPYRGGWITDPLLIDGAFQLAILWCCEEAGAPSLPGFIARYRQYQVGLPKDGATCILRVRDRSRAKMVADVAFVDARGALVAELSGYECTIDPMLRDAFRRTEESAERSVYAAPA